MCRVYVDTHPLNVEVVLCVVTPTPRSLPLARLLSSRVLLTFVLWPRWRCGWSPPSHLTVRCSFDVGDSHAFAFDEDPENSRARATALRSTPIAHARTHVNSYAGKRRQQQGQKEPTAMDCSDYLSTHEFSFSSLSVGLCASPRLKPHDSVTADAPFCSRRYWSIG